MLTLLNQEKTDLIDSYLIFRATFLELEINRVGKSRCKTTQNCDPQQVLHHLSKYSEFCYSRQKPVLSLKQLQADWTRAGQNEICCTASLLLYTVINFFGSLIATTKRTFRLFSLQCTFKRPSVKLHQGGKKQYFCTSFFANSTKIRIDGIDSDSGLSGLWVLLKRRSADCADYSLQIAYSKQNKNLKKNRLKKLEFPNETACI